MTRLDEPDAPAPPTASARHLEAWQKYLERMPKLKEKKIKFIFDEWGCRNRQMVAGNYQAAGNVELAQLRIALQRDLPQLRYDQLTCATGGCAGHPPQQVNPGAARAAWRPGIKRIDMTGVVGTCTGPNRINMTTLTIADLGRALFPASGMLNSLQVSEYPMSIGDLASIIGISQSTASYHTEILLHAGLVRVHEDGSRHVVEGIYRELRVPLRDQ